MSNYPSPSELDDMVNHPTHYAVGWSNGAEVIDITENLNFNRGNAVKYIARAGKKSEDRELGDLRKAAWYLDREISRLSGVDESPEPFWTPELVDQWVDALHELSVGWGLPVSKDEIREIFDNELKGSE